MLKFIVSVMLENRVDMLTKSKTYLANVFSTLCGQIVKFWDQSEMKIVKVIINSMLQVIFFTREYLEEFCNNGIVEKIVNTPLLTQIVK